MRSNAALIHLDRGARRGKQVIDVMQLQVAARGRLQ